MRIESRDFHVTLTHKATLMNIKLQLDKPMSRELEKPER